MTEYNELTKRLLAQGYTADNYPDNVTLAKNYHRRGSEDPLDNYDGGFEYKRWWIFEQTFKTPCGLQCKGLNLFTGLSHNGLHWSFENDLQLVLCPYMKNECELKRPDAGVVNPHHCNVHLTDEEYRYEGSVESIQKLYDDEIRREKISFILEHKGRVCERHMYYNKIEKKWEFHYDPETCTRMNCFGEYSQNTDVSKCPVLGKPLSKAKGNVYYDTKMVTERIDLKGTMFEGELYTEISKGNRYFKSPVSIDLCKIFVNMCKDRVRDYVKMKYSSELFFNNYHGRKFSIEVMNIRAEEKESRDLQQDMQDIKAGIRIYHASDDLKNAKAEKSKRRKEAQQKRIEKLEKKILKVGYDNLDEHSLDRVHADKWLTPERIDELEEMREQKVKAEQEKPVQLSLFDM